MAVTPQLPGRTVFVDGQEKLYFSGTSYLGISKDPRFHALLQEGMARYGSNYGSSRSSNLQLAVYEEAEHLLKQKAGAQAALTFSSGYLVGQAVVNVLDIGQPFLYAPGTHPAVWRSTQDGWHGEYPTWAIGISTQVAARLEESVVIVANSLNPLLAEKHRFDWISDLPADKKITVVVDDSHGFGITGPNGAGIFPELQQLAGSNVQIILISSLGKACGIPGGVAFGEQTFIDQLSKSPFYTAGSPVPPAYMFALVQAEELYAEARVKLRANVFHFQSHIENTGLFHYFDQYPVFYTPNNALADSLAPHCIISSFPYPDPESETITRVVINSLHTEEDIGRLSEWVLRHVASL